MVRRAPDELSHRHRPETPLEPLLHVTREHEDAVASLDHALAKRELGSEQLASERGGDLPPERGPALAVGPFHLREIQSGISALDRKSEKQVLEHEVVEHDHSGITERGIEGIAVIGAVADLIEVEVESLPLRHFVVVARVVPGEHRLDVGVRRLLLGDDEMDLEAFLPEVGEELLAVVGDAGTGGRQRAPESELHRLCLDPFIEGAP